MKSPEPEIKLAQIMAKTREEGKCLIYTGHLAKKGYPEIVWRGRQWRGNRLVYLLIHGSLPVGQLICHTCDVRSCINPDHLYAGTPAQNSGDLVVRGRHHKKRTTHCPYGHEYTKENTKIRKGKWRSCKACYRSKQSEYTKRYHEKRKSLLEVPE